MARPRPITQPERPFPRVLGGVLLVVALLATSAGGQSTDEGYSPVYVADSLAAQDRIAESRRLLDEGRPLDAAAALQPVIETMADKLIAHDSGVYISAPQWIEDHLRTDATLLAAYRQTFGPVAERRWIEARDRLDVRALAEVFDHYGLTDAGREAALTLAALQLEATDADGARAVLDRLPRLHERSTLGARYELLRAVTAILRGEVSEAAAHRDALRRLDAAEELRQLDALEHRIHPPSRLSPARLSEPRLPRTDAPLWAASLDDYRREGLLEQTTRYRANPEPVGLTVLPTVAPRANGAADVLMNVGSAILAVDQLSGWPRWVYERIERPDLTELSPAMRVALQRGQPILDRRGVLVLGERVFGVVGEAVYWSQRRQPELRMTELICLDRADGRMLWRYGPEQLDPSLAQCFFVGTPVSDGQRLYVAARRYRTTGFLDSFLLALDPTDGSLLWRRHLSSLATGQRSGQAPPIEVLFDAGRVYVHDCAAAVAAMDARSGRALWLRVLVETTEVTDRRSFRTLRSRRTDEAISPLVLTAAGLIVPSNNEAETVFLLDPNTGRLVRRLDSEPWTEVKVLADAGDHVLAMGEQLTLFDGRTLEPIWSRPLTAAPVGGVISQPQVTARHALVSVPDGVRVFELATGELVRTLSAREPGNVVAADGQILLATARRLDSYLDWSEAYVRLRQRAEESPDNPRHGLALAHLALNAGEDAAVLEGADQALAALRLNLSSEPDRGGGASTRADTQTMVFEQLLALAQADRGGLAELRDGLYERLRAAASTTEQRIAYHFAAAALDEQLERWAAAVDHYQALLTDGQLASAMHRRDALVQRSGDAARRRLERLIARQGPAIYERYAQLAEQQLRAIDVEDADPRVLVGLADRYPAASASVRALFAAAMRWQQMGDLRQASRLLRRAYPQADSLDLAAQISGRLASAYERQGLANRAAQWLRRVAREHPGIRPVRDGQPTTVQAWLAQLSQHGDTVAAAALLPTLAPPLEDRALRIDGRFMAPVHPDMAAGQPRDRFLLADDDGLMLYLASGPAAPQWTARLEAPDAQVLAFDGEQVLLWSAHGGTMWALDAVTGEPTWGPLDARRQMEQLGDAASRQAAMPLEQRRFMEMVNNEPILPRARAEAMAARERPIRTAVDDSVAVTIDEVGRLLAVDRWTGHMLWRTMTSLDRSGPVAIGSGVVAIGGVVGEGTSALGGGLLVLDAQTGEQLFPMIEDREPLSWLGVTADGLLIAGGSRTVTAYHVETGEVAWRYAISSTALIGRAWIEGRTLLALVEGGGAELIDLQAGTQLARLPLSTSPRQVASVPPVEDETEGTHWLLLSDGGLTALARSGAVRWRDAVEHEFVGPLAQAAAADVAVLTHDDGEQAWVWCLDQITGRIIDEQTYNRTALLDSVQVMDHRLLLAFEDHVLLIDATGE